MSFDKDGQNLDLHNNYALQSFSYDTTHRSLRFSWELSDGEWVPDNLPKTLHLVLSGVYLLKARERSPEAPFTEDGFLDSIGFIWNSMIDELEGYTKHQPDAECNHLNINFLSGFAVKVGAEKATLTTVNERRFEWP